MRETRLIFLEGLPGAGKSTTAEYVAALVAQAGLGVRHLPEVQSDHPLNVGGAVHPAGDTTGDELFRRYSVDSYVAESLDRWRSMVTTAAANDSVYVLDSYPYQNAARVLLQLDAPRSVIEAYARDVETVARPLEPVLIYLEREITPEAVGATFSSRGEAWTAYAVEVMTNCPYSHHRNLTGLSGALAVLEVYRTLVHDLMSQSVLPCLALERCSEDWTACHQRIAAFLGL